MTSATRPDGVRIACAWLIGLAACGSSSTDPGFVLRDSLGIEIAENTAPEWGEGEAWTIPTEPLLDVGVREGDSVYQFFRVLDAMLLDNGDVVVLNSGSRELRFFDSTGTYIRSVGREGGGPGEFELPVRMDRHGADSIRVYDIQSYRVSMFSLSGAFGSSFRINRDGSMPFLTSTEAFADGTLLANDYSGDERRTVPGTYRRNGTVVRFSPQSGILDTIATLPASEYTVLSSASGSLSAAFSHRLHAVAVGDTAYIGNGDYFDVEVRGLDGTLHRIVRKVQPQLPITETLLEERLERRRNRTTRAGGLSMPDAFFEEQGFAETLPAYSGFMVDRVGYLWVENYRPFREGPVVWTVFDPRGRMLGDVVQPESSRIVEIGADYVLAVWWDELDVEHVRLSRLDKTRTRV